MIELETEAREAAAPPPKRPLLRYHGGKWRLAPWIVGMMPAHRVYVEPYGGGASVLLRKPRSYAEIYNDLDGEIVNLFQVCRDRGPELREAVRLTPFARAEFEASYEPAEDALEQARRTLVRCGMGFGSSAFSVRQVTGFRGSATRSGSTPAGDWAGQPAALDDVTERLRGVTIERRDALQVMRYHDAPDTLHYLDPPYVHATRVTWGNGKDCYRHEMTDAEHGAMAACAWDLEGMVIVSGYRCAQYDDLFAEWERRDMDSLADGAVKRVESVWLSPSAAAMAQQGEIAFGSGGVA